MSGHGAATAFNRESLGIFVVFYLFIYKLTQWGSVENIVLYHKNIMKIITIWNTLVGISVSGVCGFLVCVVGVWGCRQALNRLKINRLFWRKIIWTTRTPRSCLVKLLTVIGCSSRGGAGDTKKWVPHDCSLYCILQLPLVPKSFGWHLANFILDQDIPCTKSE